MTALVTVAHSLDIPVTVMKFTTGTWTISESSGLLKAAKGAADETAVISVPISIPRRDSELGIMLNAVTVNLRVATADLDAVLAGTLYRVNRLAATTAGTNDTATALTITETGTGVTANAADRKYTATITTPAWDYGTQPYCTYLLSLSANAGATTVITVNGAVAYYNLLT